MGIKVKVVAYGLRNSTWKDSLAAVHGANEELVDSFTAGIQIIRYYGIEQPSLRRDQLVG